MVWVVSVACLELPISVLKTLRKIFVSSPSSSTADRNFGLSCQILKWTTVEVLLGFSRYDKT